MSALRQGLASLAGWTVGPDLREFAGNWSRRVLGPKNLEIARLERRHAAAGRCFVIGNGPSLKGMDLRPLVGATTIGANSFYKHPDSAAIDLDYLCIFDPHFMRDDLRSVEWHRTIAERLPATTMVMHHSARSLVASHGLYPGRELYYIHAGFHTSRLRYVDLDFRFPRNIGMTTGSSIAIPLAIHLGFREIVLIGFDCNWLADTGGSYHFYDTHEYFPEFDSVDSDNRGYGYEAFLRIILREFESHRMIRAKAEERGVSIINATRGGLLDVYPRAEYESLLP